jgi:hypothetical protein
MGAADGFLIQLSFETNVIYWRGPSPFFYAPIPQIHVAELRRVAKVVTYGWGMIPVDVTIGEVAFTTSLFPKDDTYLLPIKAIVRRQAEITAGDTIMVELTIRSDRD